MGLSDTLVGILLIILGAGMVVWLHLDDKKRPSPVKGKLDVIKDAIDDFEQRRGAAKWFSTILIIQAVIIPTTKGMVYSIGTTIVMLGGGLLGGFDWLKSLFELADDKIPDAYPAETPEIDAARP